MRIARFEHDGAVRVGAVDGDGERVAPFDAGVDVYDLLDDVAARDAALAGAGDPLELHGVRLLAPLVPHSMRDFMTFEEHVDGTSRAGGQEAKIAPEWYEAPRFYFTNVAAVTGPYDDVAIAPGSQVQDFELEVAAVIGREGFNLSPAAARDHIAGYVVFNDWSARDLQFREMRARLGPAKGKDAANTLGPWLVTADELEPYRRDDRLHLEMTVSINGERYGDDTLANMAWSFEEMAAYASRGTRVVPGDVLGSGTCGMGCLAETWGRTGVQEPAPLQPGDVVELTVEGIGTLRNRLVAGVEVIEVPPARPAAHRRPRSY
jgi:2-keto-4-pentenoate hydratase/2-oxohepta-3-ene-1,7-dioic acid hydratase in catechol pathway